jgi:hypothetical protein
MISDDVGQYTVRREMYRAMSRYSNDDQEGGKQESESGIRNQESGITLLCLHAIGSASRLRLGCEEDISTDRSTDERNEHMNISTYQHININMSTE